MSDTNENPVQENNAELVKSEPKNVEVSADLLNEAVTQLRKLTELRQRESERQERAMTLMQKQIKRQGLLSRYVILMSSLAVLIGIGLAYLVSDAARKADVTAESLLLVDGRLADASKVVADATEQQAAGLNEVRSEVVATRETTANLSREITEAQASLGKNITEELQATRETQAGVIQKVEEQLGAVREERDQVRGEVRNLLEEKTAEFVSKEMQLVAEREAIVEATKKSKEEQRALIQQTIERLSAMSASLTEVEAAADAPTEAEVNEAVAEAEDIAGEVENPTETIEAHVEDTATVVEEAAPVVEDAVSEPAPETAVEEPAPEAPVAE